MLALTGRLQPLQLMTHNGSLETVELLRTNSSSYLDPRVAFHSPKNKTGRFVKDGCKSHLNAVSCSVTSMTFGLSPLSSSEDCALLGHYAASSGNSLHTFRGSLSVHSSKVQGSKWKKQMGPIGCPETSVRNYHYSLHNNPEERSSVT